MQWDRFQNFQTVLCDLKKEIAWSQNYCSYTSLLLLAIAMQRQHFNETVRQWHMKSDITSTGSIHHFHSYPVSDGFDFCGSWHICIMIMHRCMGMCFHTYHMCYLHAVPGPSSWVHVPLWYTHVAMHVHYSLQEVNHTFLCSQTAWRGYHTHD